MFVGMCGRFTRHYTWREIYELYQLTLGSNQSNLLPRYNICPTTTIDAVLPAFDQRQLVQMRWGLVPGWWSALRRAKSNPTRPPPLMASASGVDHQRFSTRFERLRISHEVCNVQH